VGVCRLPCACGGGRRRGSNTLAVGAFPLRSLPIASWWAAADAGRVPRSYCPFCFHGSRPERVASIGPPLRARPPSLTDWYTMRCCRSNGGLVGQVRAYTSMLGASRGDSSAQSFHKVPVAFPTCRPRRYRFHARTASIVSACSSAVCSARSQSRARASVN